MATCFIIQPFDGGPFDKRYKELVEPAIKEAGLEPYREDLDPSVVVPIEDIERGIEHADDRTQRDIRHVVKEAPPVRIARRITT